MSSELYKLLLFLTVVAWKMVYAGNITCEYQQCANKQVNCTNDGSDCNIVCMQNGCSGGTINCVDGYQCNIYLYQYESAFKATFNGNKATKLFVTTSSAANNGVDQLSNAVINCPYDGECVIQCNSTAYQACYNINIKAEYSKNLIVSCKNGTEVCSQVDIWCPINGGKCNIKGETNSASMINMNIYSVHGFDTVVVTGKPTAKSIGTMFCLPQYTASCIIKPNDNNHCDSSSDNTCDHPITTTSTTTSTSTSTSTTTYIPTNITTTIMPYNTKYSDIDIQYIVMCCVMILVTSFVIYLSYNRFVAISIWKIKFAVIVQIISLWLSYVTWIIQIINKNNSILYDFFDVITYSSFVVAIMSFYVYILLRLYYTFSKSIYKLRQTSMYFHVLIVIFIPIWYSILIRYDNHIHFYFIFCGIGFLFIFIGLLILILSFNRNLFNLLVSLEHERNTVVIAVNTELDALKLISKHTLLGTIILSNYILFIMMICVLNFLSFEPTDIVWITYEWFLAFLMSVNLICVYFGSKANDKEYNWICGKCHSKLMIVCGLLVNKKANQQEKKVMYLSFPEIKDTD